MHVPAENTGELLFGDVWSYVVDQEICLCRLKRNTNGRSSGGRLLMMDRLRKCR